MNRILLGRFCHFSKSYRNVSDQEKKKNMFMLISCFIYFYLTLRYFLEVLSVIANPHDWFLHIMTAEHVKQTGQHPALTARGGSPIEINSLSDIKGH